MGTSDLVFLFIHTLYISIFYFIILVYIEVDFIKFVDALPICEVDNLTKCNSHAYTKPKIDTCHVIHSKYPLFNDVCYVQLCCLPH